MFEHIKKKYEGIMSLPTYGEKIKRVVEKGLFFSPCYVLNQPKMVSKKIDRKGNLPNFSSITTMDKSKINKARFCLYSLLLPIHDREVALQEFVNLSCCCLEGEEEQIKEFQN